MKVHCVSKTNAALQYTEMQTCLQQHKTNAGYDQSLLLEGYKTSDRVYTVDREDRTVKGAAVA